MSTDRKTLEREFEELLIEVLTQDHDLDVRRDTDSLDRRRNQTATLAFDYDYTDGLKGKVTITLLEVDDYSASLSVNLSSPPAMRRSAENCESLALYLTEYLDGQQEDLMARLGEDDPHFGRRDDDYV